MDDKIDNLINISMEATTEEINKNLLLSSGVNDEDGKWELIVRYVGEGDFQQKYKDVEFVKLSGGYGIATMPINAIESFANDDEVIFVEKPKPLLFSTIIGKSASCINPVTENYGLHGEGVIVAVIDSGIDYANNAFRNADGSTRILELWDQSIDESSINNVYRKGRIFTRDEINQALLMETRQQQYEIVPSRDLSGHGTFVAGIAAGNFAQNRNNNIGIATRSDLLIVKLSNPKENSFPRTIELMEALDYVMKKAIELNRPVAVNLSFGSTYGSHDGESLLETFTDFIADNGRMAIVVGTGNEGASALHTNGTAMERQVDRIEFEVSTYETSVNLQLWKNYADIFDIEIISPDGKRSGILREINTVSRVALDSTDVLFYYGTPKPYSNNQEIFVALFAQDDNITSGIWSIEITGRKIVNGGYDIWISGGTAIGSGTGFLNPNPDTTLTIPSTASKVISVGAYDARTDRMAEFSGRGYTRENIQRKPDIVAPGVDVMSVAVGGGNDIRSGTSMATAFVTGSAALMMEWGIVNRNDLFMYGEKLKAYLIRGARKLPGYEQYPNPQTGWGALCVKDSLPL